MARNAVSRPDGQTSNTRNHALASHDTTRSGDGNRTRMTSLEGWGSAIELRPRDRPARRARWGVAIGRVPVPGHFSHRGRLRGRGREAALPKLVGRITHP